MHRLMICALLLTAAALAREQAVRADPSPSSTPVYCIPNMYGPPACEGPPADGSPGRCYGVLVFLAYYPGGDAASAAWVVGPFPYAQCDLRVSQMQKVTPTPIKNGQLVGVFKGSARQTRFMLKNAYRCVRDETKPLGAGPDKTRGIYECSPP